MVVVNKFTLTGTENDGFRHRYSVKKNEDFKKAFVKFMVWLEFKEDDLKYEFISEYSDEDGEPVSYELKIKDIEDVCSYYQNEKYEVDIFYGRFKIILVVRTKERDSMVKYLKNEAKWIKSFEAKRIREKKKVAPRLVMKGRAK